MKIKSEKNIENTSNLIWARLRYSPYWPAKLVATPPEIGPAPLNKVCVLFFGTKQFGFIDNAKYKDYAQNRENLVTKGRGAEFREAVKQMDEYISDPIKFRSNAVVKPIGRRVKIKTEQGIERRNVVLAEKIQPKVETDRSHENEEFQREKQKLIKAYVDQKAENQKITFDLKQKCGEYQKLNEAKKLIDQDAALKAKELATLKSAFTQMEKKLEQKTAEYDKKVSLLKHEKQTLSAQISQLQLAMSQINRKMANEENIQESDIFEVEQILDDKMKGKIRHFHVRWKGFTSKDDTWERETNLINCSDILKNYLELKKGKK